MVLAPLKAAIEHREINLRLPGEPPKQRRKILNGMADKDGKPARSSPGGGGLEAVAGFIAVIRRVGTVFGLSQALRR
jgi:hypothetical protein